MLRVVKITEAESRLGLSGAGVREEEEMGSYSLMGIEIQFYKIKSYGDEWLKVMQHYKYI